jgi:hypothetical protein
VHTRALEARANGNLASGLDNAAGSTQALGVELRIAHTLSVSLETGRAPTRTTRTGFLDTLSAALYS